MTDAPQPPRRLLDWRILPLLAVTVLVIWLLIRNMAGVDAFVDAVAGANWKLVAIAAGGVFVNLFLAVFRWQLILRSMSYSVGFLRCAYAVIAVWPLAVVIPARAGDVLRAGAVRDEVPFVEGAGSVMVEKAFDVQSLCLLSIVGTLWHGFYVWTAVVIAMLAAEWTVVIVLLKYSDAVLRKKSLERFAPKLRQLLVALRAVLRSPKHLAGVAVSSMSAWIISSGIVHVLLMATGYSIHFGVTLSLWPIAVFAGMLPVTVAGMGTRDALFMFALKATAEGPVAEDSVLASTLGYSLLGTWMLVIIALPFAIRFALRLTRQPVTRTTDA